MIDRLRKAQDDDSGFTLIELLVVVIIIGILAAIAIPTFLAQRESAWDSDAQSTLRNAATAMESYAADNEGSYENATETLLADFGLNVSSDITFDIGTPTSTSYSMTASHNDSDTTFVLDSSNGQVQEQ